jgi:predicted MFS family arabinose efflux permease
LNIATNKEKSMYARIFSGSQKEVSFQQGLLFCFAFAFLPMAGVTYAIVFFLSGGEDFQTLNPGTPIGVLVLALMGVVARVWIGKGAFRLHISESIFSGMLYLGMAAAGFMFFELYAVAASACLIMAAGFVFLYMYDSRVFSALDGSNFSNSDAGAATSEDSEFMSPAPRTRSRRSLRRKKNKHKKK